MAVKTITPKQSTLVHTPGRCKRLFRLQVEAKAGPLRLDTRIQIDADGEVDLLLILFRDLFQIIKLVKVIHMYGVLQKNPQK